MERWAMGLLVLSMVGSCGKRTALPTDGAVPVDVAQADTWVAVDGAVPVDVGGACDVLAQVAQVTLESSDHMKTTPALASDGERFAVVWHTQPAPVSSMNGELRFAVIDGTGTPSVPDGVSLGGDNGSLEPALLASSGEYAVVHWPSSANGGGAVLRRVDGTGQTLGIVPLTGMVTHAALAPHPSGYAVLVASPGNPQILVVDASGSIAATTSITTAQVMASLWLAPRPGGFVAGLHTTNKNATLYLLDQQMTQVEMGNVGHGALIQSPSFAALPDGFAATYLEPSVETEIYDSVGASTGYHTIGTATSTAPSDTTALTALAWTGQRLVAGYPSTVPGQFLLRVLDADGTPVGTATQLGGCLATSSAIRMAWGKGLLAVASLDHASGLPNSCICVTLLRCQ
jgi:hypothetical protein